MREVFIGKDNLKVARVGAAYWTVNWTVGESLS